MSVIKMSVIKLLLVEDDAILRYMIRNGMEDVVGGYEIVEAANGSEGLDQWNENRPDIIVSDVDMPVMDGYKMVEKIREIDNMIPIVFASAMDQSSDVMRGYEVGVNNYIKKPYSPEELDAHVQALLRNIKGGRMENKTNIYTVGRLKFNAPKAELTTSEGQHVPLTMLELQILQLLCLHIGETIGRDTILETLWPDVDYFYASRRLDVFLTKLRKILSIDSSVSISTIRGVGIKLNT